MESGGGGGAVPTGCYKCGRPGHWSRDCPSNPNQNPNPSSSNYSKPNLSNFKDTDDGIVGDAKPLQKPTEKLKKVPRSRPKLTPDLLLSNDGIGYVLRHFPRAFKYRGRGHENENETGSLLIPKELAEDHFPLLAKSQYPYTRLVKVTTPEGSDSDMLVGFNNMEDAFEIRDDWWKECVKHNNFGTTDMVSDLGNLIGLYAEWHSHLLPYYSFDQFVHKVEQVGATKRVKICLGGLRDRVANGGDPTKLHEPPAEHNISNDDGEAMNIEVPCLVQEDTSLKNHDTNDLQEDMFEEIYKQATEEQSPAAVHGHSVATDHLSSHHGSVEDLANDTPDDIFREIQVSDEQKTRMEANRLKALEKAAARARALQTT